MSVTLHCVNSTLVQRSYLYIYFLSLLTQFPLRRDTYFLSPSSPETPQRQETKMNSLYQIRPKILDGMKVIIFVGSSPSQGDIFFFEI